MLNFIIMYDTLEKCSCSNPLTPYANHFNLSKVKDSYNSRFILFKCDYCHKEYGYHFSIVKLS